MPPGARTHLRPAPNTMSPPPVPLPPRPRRAQAGAASPRDAAQLLHGLALLRLRRPGALKAAAAALSDARYPAHAAHVALGAWALGRLRHADPGVLPALSQRAQETKLYLRPWSMAALMRTFTVAHIEDAPLAAAVAEVRGVGGRPLAHGLGRGRWRGLGGKGAAPPARHALLPFPT